jgi:signal transduction histidine kinase
MLATLTTIESVGSMIEAGWDRHLSGGLSGPDGLSLVVEVAHDLRSPLTSILFLAETLQRGQSGDVNELQHRQLGLIYSAALGLSTVASNVIELARGGERLADDQPAPFSVTDILESVHDIVHPMAEEKGLTVRLLPPASDHRLGYPHALSRVLLNLTTNALKFTEEGFVEIVAREVDLTQLEFSVRDSGPGISGRALETLYLPFRPSGDRYAFSGTGLGLELSRRLVEAMGSELLVETKPRWGTRFYFRLGLKPV